jgi:hypothetical protein
MLAVEEERVHLQAQVVLVVAVLVNLVELVIQD